jgi:2-polyprenyl-3-methyl-5-hydroxy-6-metoxy-1,4-benzoquinol methylase
MKLQVNNYDLPTNDHLWLDQTSPSDYVYDPMCNGCGFIMTPYSLIKNINNDVGLVTGLCTECGFTKRLRNLSNDAFTKHFSKRWLTCRQEKLLPFYHVYNETSDCLPKNSSVLDIGCGIGSYLLPYHLNGHDVHGVEPSEHRWGTANEHLPNIFNGNAEQYLLNCKQKFDLIYIHDVLQFVEDPFRLLDLSAHCLKENGYIWFKIGVYFKRSNFCQFSHFGVLRNYVNLYCLKNFVSNNSLRLIKYKNMPIEVLLQKSNLSSNFPIKSKKTNLNDIGKFVKKTIGYNSLKLLGKSKVSYLNRNINLSLIEKESVLPVEFIYDKNTLPILLK